MLKNELKSLIKQKSLWVLLFFGILFLDALGAVFPNIFNRHITLFMPLPLLLLYYVLNSKKIERLFVAALFLSFLGLIYFNTVFETYNYIGVIFNTIGFFCYVIILFKKHEMISLKLMFTVSVFVVALVTLLLIFYAEGINKRFIFYSVLGYIFSVTMFMFFALILYFSKKTKTNILLLFAATSIFLSSCFQGYNLFVKPEPILLFLAIISLSLTHFFMGKFLLEEENMFEKD